MVDSEGSSVKKQPKNKILDGGLYFALYDNDIHIA